MVSAETRKGMVFSSLSGVLGGFWLALFFKWTDGFDPSAWTWWVIFILWIVETIGYSIVLHRLWPKKDL